MDLVGKGDGQRFVCVCGHKEKLSSFEERKKKEGKGASKKDVNHYLRKQAKEAKEPKPFKETKEKQPRQPKEKTFKELL